MMTIGKKKPPQEDEEMEEDEPGVDPDDTKEDEDKEFGTVEYLTDRVLEDGVLWWGVHWLETQEATWCLDTNIPRISKYNKMRAAGEKGQFMLRHPGDREQPPLWQGRGTLHRGRLLQAGVYRHLPEATAADE